MAAATSSVEPFLVANTTRIWLKAYTSYHKMIWLPANRGVGPNVTSVVMTLVSATQTETGRLDLAHVGVAARELGHIRVRLGDTEGAEQAFRRAHEYGISPRARHVAHSARARRPSGATQGLQTALDALGDSRLEHVSERPSGNDKIAFASPTYPGSDHQDLRGELPAPCPAVPPAGQGRPRPARCMPPREWAPGTGGATAPAAGRRASRRSPPHRTSQASRSSAALAGSPWRPSSPAAPRP